jgi:hypothetical protein
LKSNNLIGLDTSQYSVDLKAGDKITLTSQLERTALQLNLYTNYGDSERNDYWSVQPRQSRTITVAHDSKAIAWNASFANLAWVNKGETALPYEPYTENPIELNSSPDGTIRDGIYGTPDNWYKREYIGKVVLDGSESWVKRTDGAFQINVNGVVNKTVAVSNYFNYNRTSETTGTFYTVDNYLRFFYNEMSTVEDFKTWLSTHNTIVWYQKAQYTDIPITDTTLINQLNDIYNNAHSYNGTTNITTTYEDGNEQMYLDIEALKDVWDTSL